MDPEETRAVLGRAADLAQRYQASLAERRVGPALGTTVERLRAALGGPLPEGPADPTQVVEALARAAEPGIVASGSPRYFGFVIGGTLPAALGADWLTSAWDQNGGLYVSSPASAVAEEVAGAWLLELLGLPATWGVGFTTGVTMANFTALAAARHAVLRAAGWDVEEDGLIGAPAITVVVGADAHASLLIALRLVGFGRGRAIRVPTDDQGRMLAPALREVLAGASGPLIVCAQAGEVNTGAFDPLGEVADAVREHPAAWLHVDGAFGLWAAVPPSLRQQVAGLERVDSCATDAHKWLNVPYDSGLVFVRDVAALRAAMGVAAAYLPPATGAARDPFDYVPEMSRRARGFHDEQVRLGRRVERSGALASVISRRSVRRMVDQS